MVTKLRLLAARREDQATGHKQTVATLLKETVPELCRLVKKAQDEQKRLNQAAALLEGIDLEN